MPRSRSARPAARLPSTTCWPRCLALQEEEKRQGLPAARRSYTDAQIRTQLLCMVVGGPPQPPMVVPQAMEQLLRRPEALAAAKAAALDRDGDDALRRIVRETMRFDPLAPGLPRVAVKDWTVAAGTARARRIPAGAAVSAAFASAMMDGRRLPSPRRFDPGRRDHEYIHFGHGLHECFGRHINGAILHRMLKPLLRMPELRRAPGAQGRLSKSGPFAEQLSVEFG